jgi:hypothetical protein
MAPWYRAVGYDHLLGPPPGTAAGPPQPLWPQGPRRGSRFTPATVPAGLPPTPAQTGIDALYLAEDESTPLMEIVGAIRPAGSRIPLRFTPQVMLTVDGVLSDILDLTSSATQTALGVTAPQQLTAPWIVAQSRFLNGTGPMPPTQVLGQEAFRCGVIVGLRYQSSKNPTGIGLVVFTARLIPGQHRLAVHNQPHGKLQQSLP